MAEVRQPEGSILTVSTKTGMTIFGADLTPSAFVSCTFFHSQSASLFRGTCPQTPLIAYSHLSTHNGHTSPK